MSEEHDPLDTELANLKRLNGVLEKVIAAMDASTVNAENVNSTVQSADKLLDLWIRVLASSDVSQKLILDEGWNGATADLQAVEYENSQASRKAQEMREAASRRQAEMEARAQKEQEDRERLDSMPSSSAGTRSSRGRGSVSGRGTGTTRPAIKKDVVSAYAQTIRAKSSMTGASTNRPDSGPMQASQPLNNTSLSSSGSVQNPGRGARGRGAPVVVRGTRASRGRQVGVGRAQDQTAFR